MNNCIGQALLARRMGKPRVIAETGAGQHGVASATVAARFGLTCQVYMGEEDIRRQALNVYRMKLLGAEVIPVHSGSRTLKDALNEALRDWVTNVDDTHYIIGTVAGPHPYPPWYEIFNPSSAAKRERSAWNWRAGCPMSWSPASAAGPMPWACSIPSSMTWMSGWWVWRQPASGLRRAAMPRR